MSATIIWTIGSMECKVQEGSLTDVVVVAEWRCTGYDGQVNSYSYGNCSFPAPSGSFTPYPDLTQDQVLGWCWANGVNKTETEAKVSAQVAKLVNPSVVVLPLPWLPPTP